MATAPARRNEIHTAAPATSPAAPSSEKIPAPTIAPTPMKAAWRTFSVPDGPSAAVLVTMGSFNGSGRRAPSPRAGGPAPPPMGWHEGRERTGRRPRADPRRPATTPAVRRAARRGHERGRPDRLRGPGTARPRVHRLPGPGGADQRLPPLP